MRSPVASFTSAGGRTFTVGEGEHEERFPLDTLWSDTYPILLDGKPAGKLFCSDRYGRTCGNLPRWHASTRELYWSKAADAPTGIGFDVAAFDTAEAACAAWARSADQILDWSEGKPVRGQFGIVQRGASR